MKKLILTMCAISAFSFAHAKSGEVTDYDSKTGKYTVGSNVKIIQMKKNNFAQMKPNRGEATDHDPRRMNEKSNSFFK